MDPNAYREFRDFETTHWWFIGRHSIFRHLFEQKVLPGLGSKPGELRSFDLGCGMGATLGMLRAFGSASGSDIEPEAVRHCRSRGFARTLVGGGEKLPFRDACFDAITAFDTIEHIPDDLAAVRECLRVLRPGGRMFVSGPAYQFLYAHQDRVVHHQRRYTTTRMRRLFESAGFQVEKASYINFFLFPLILPAVLLIKLKERLRPPPPTQNTSNVSVPIAGWINKTLAAIFSFERHVLARISVPFGHSLILIARKPIPPK